MHWIISLQLNKCSFIYPLQMSGIISPVFPVSIEISTCFITTHPQLLQLSKPNYSTPASLCQPMMSPTERQWNCWLAAFGRQGEEEGRRGDERRGSEEKISSWEVSKVGKWGRGTPGVLAGPCVGTAGINQPALLLDPENPAYPFLLPLWLR